MQKFLRYSYIHSSENLDIYDHLHYVHKFCLPRSIEMCIVFTVYYTNYKHCCLSLFFFVQAVRCSEVIGYYISVEVWTSLVLPAVRTSAGCYMASSQEKSTVAVGPVQCTSCLMVLAACLHGAKNDKLQPFLKVHIYSVILYMNCTCFLFTYIWWKYYSFHG